MATKRLTSLDLTHLELLNLRFQVLASDPSSPAEAWAYWNSVAHEFRVYDGTTWVALGSGGSGISDVAIASANGFAGTSDGDPSVPTLTLSTTITGITKGNGTALSAAVAGTDYAVATNGSNGNILVSDGAGGFGTALVVDTDAALAANSNSRIATQAAVKAYVDLLSQGLDFKASVRVASTANGTLASAFENGDTVDGITLATGDRILLKNQSTGAENGIYTINASGAPTRALDANGSGEISKGSLVFVESGTANAGQLWICTATASTPWVPGTDSSTWTQFAGAADIVAGAGLTKTGNTVDVGAGAGIIVNANDVAIDTAVVVSKFSQLIGNGASTSIAVTHSLGTKDITYSVRDASTDEFVECDVVATSTSQATFTFASAPASNAYRVTIHA